MNKESPQTEDSLTVKMGLAFQDGEKYGRQKTLEDVEEMIKEVSRLEKLKLNTKKRYANPQTVVTLDCLIEKLKEMKE